MGFTNKIIFFLCCSVIFTSCKKTDKLIFSYIVATNPDGGMINLKNALGTDFDTAFFWSECTNEKDIEMVLGIPYTQKTFLQDSEHKLILVKNHEIVFDNNFYCKKIEFFFYGGKYHKKNNNMEYTMWTDSIFIATLKEKEDGMFYQLMPVYEWNQFVENVILVVG